MIGVCAINDNNVVIDDMARRKMIEQVLTSPATLLLVDTMFACVVSGYGLWSRRFRNTV
jgi:hypothetical protein